MRTQINTLLTKWAQLKPTREGYLDAAEQLAAFGRQPRCMALWPRPPVMLTATIDDGWGHGLDVIQTLAEAAGIRVEPLGVLQRPEAVVAACRQTHPDLLGLTVLQFDSDEAVRHVAAHLPAGTTLIAGGAAYQFDPDFAERSQTPFVATNGAAFLRFLLNYHLSDMP